METTTDNQPNAGEFFVFGPDLESNRPFRGATFENVQKLLTPPRLILRPSGGGFPPLREKPKLVLDPSQGPKPRDLEGGFSGYWLVSERLREAMVSVDNDAFAFAECDVRLGNGAQGPKYFLCDVVRVLDAVDEDNSKLKIEIDDDFVNGKYYATGGGASLAFKREVLGDAHVFLTPYSLFVVCDQVFKAAVHRAGVPEDPELSGISFIDASDI
ncbi:DUF1629 domain-containing protein [Xanthomonas axonopodis pv. poinsettiicola]|uniref:DUF1629 domain-containing protein n=1 Tax=Xanthomonas TaxID=338 RepID=UPI001E35C22D|nr:DUF1629 domain-containing protein [Xanthomonas codiaei]MCC8538921.1 DUF1629 domain-containing protein [Xanthomonas codiaei]